MPQSKQCWHLGKSLMLSPRERGHVTVPAPLPRTVPGCLCTARRLGAEMEFDILQTNKEKGGKQKRKKTWLGLSSNEQRVLEIKGEKKIDQYWGSNKGGIYWHLAINLSRVNTAQESGIVCRRGLEWNQNKRMFPSAPRTAPTSASC